MSAQPEHIGSGEPPNLDIDCPAAGSLLSCVIGSLQFAAGEIIVLRVSGQVDLSSVPTLRTALDESLDRHPARLLVDLAQMTFCSARGLDLLTHTGRIAAEKAIGYAVTGVLPHINRVWTLGWDSDRPIRYPSTAAAIIGIRAAQPVHVSRPRQALGHTSRPEDFHLGPDAFPTDAPILPPQNRRGVGFSTRSDARSGS